MPNGMFEWMLGLSGFSIPTEAGVDARLKPLAGKGLNC